MLLMGQIAGVPEIAAQDAAQRPGDTETRPRSGGFFVLFCCEALSARMRAVSPGGYKHTRAPRNGPQKASSSPTSSHIGL